MERGEQLPVIDTPHQAADTYPDIAFNVAGVHLFPEKGEIFEITDSTRLARTLQMLGDTCPELATTPKEREKRLQIQKNYLLGKVTIAHQKQEFRKKIVDVEYGYNETIKLLKAINHPSTQLLRQIDSHYNHEREHDAEMRRLIHNVTTVVAWEQLRAILDYQVQTYTGHALLVRIGDLATQPSLEPSDSPAA